MYYHLHPHCKIVAGAARSAIYDLNSGKVYSINQTAAALLAQSEKNAIADASALSSVQSQFFDALTQKNIGGFYLNPPDFPIRQQELAPKPQLDFVWLELTAKCNNRCLHCYTESTAEENPGQLLPLVRWLSLIHEIRAAGCPAIQFIGGEPLLYPHWRTLIEAAAAKQYEFIELFTNATLLTDEAIDFLAAHNVHIATTIYADRADIHDEITQNQGSFAKTLAAIKKIRQKKLPLRIASILMKTNEHESEKIRQLCSSLGVEATLPDVIRPTGRGDNRALLPDVLPDNSIRPPFLIAETDFNTARFFNPCLNGKLAITPTGDVFPCVFARSTRLGNAAQTPLQQILANAALQSCWQTNKDKITKCKDCEYRYACPDCRAYAQSMDPAHDWLAAPPNCVYDPYTGLWTPPC